MHCWNAIPRANESTPPTSIVEFPPGPENAQTFHELGQNFQATETFGVHGGLERLGGNLAGWARFVKLAFRGPHGTGEDKVHPPCRTEQCGSVGVKMAAPTKSTPSSCARVQVWAHAPLPVLGLIRQTALTSRARRGSIENQLLGHRPSPDIKV